MSPYPRPLYDADGLLQGAWTAPGRYEANPNYWTEKAARAAGKVDKRRCIHGVPLNVFCPKCES